MSRPRTLPRAARLCPLLLLLGGLLGARAAVAQGAPAPVRVDAVRSEVVEERRQVTGDVRAVHRSAVAAREKGIVLELLVREGQAVAAGDVIARQDANRLELELAVLRAQVAPLESAVHEAESDVARARSDLEALERLAGREATNPKELSDARTAHAGAAARQARAEGELAVLDARIAELADRVADMEIRAPFEGTVTARRTEVGAWLGEGDPVVELVSTGRLEVWLEVPQQHLAALEGGAGRVSAVVDATGEALALERWRVVPDVSVRGRTFRLVAPVADTPSLAPGMSVTAEVPTSARAERLTASRDALLRNEVGAYAYLVMPGADGQPAHVAPVQLEVLFHLTDRAVVRSPRLAAGDRLVVEGNERLFPMAPVQPVEAAAPADRPQDGAGAGERAGDAGAGAGGGERAGDAGTRRDAAAGGADR